MNPYLDVTDFGADPNGLANSCQAFKDWSKAISDAGGGIGVVPPGTYLIEQLASADETENLTFKGCRGLRLVGYGAVLNLVCLLDDRSPPHLTGTATDPRMPEPLSVRHSRNVCIEGFEINGNAQLVTMEPGVSGSAGNCISVESCTNVTLRNLRLHHAWMDGISVRCYHDGQVLPPKTACRQIVIENCEVFACARGNISVHEARNVRITDCRIYDGGETGGSIGFMPSHGIDIEPDFPRTEGNTGQPKQFFPSDVSNGFTVIDNCELYANVGAAIVVNVRSSRVRVQGCRIENERENAYPVILSVPHGTLLDSEINTGTGRIEVGLSGTDPGNNVFTMERCLVRSDTLVVNGAPVTGGGLFINPDPTDLPHRLTQALIANNRFIHESSEPWWPMGVNGVRQDGGARFPVLGHGYRMLQLIFRDNYVFIPKEAHHGAVTPQMVAVSANVHLAENNVYETDLAGFSRPELVAMDRDWVIEIAIRLDIPVAVEVPGQSELEPVPTEELIESILAIQGGPGSFGVFYEPAPPRHPPRFAVLVRNERFVSPDNRSIGPADQSDHDNTFPYSRGLSAIGGALTLGGANRVILDDREPSQAGDGTFRPGDLVFSTSAQSPGTPIGWVCTVGGTAGVDAVFSKMPDVTP